MKSLNFYAGSNITLFHLVDSCSLWDHFVNGRQRKFLEEILELTPIDLHFLEEYVFYRKMYGWNAETELFEWANNNFFENPKFEKLKEPIFHFKERVTKNGKTIGELIFEKEQICLSFATKMSDFIEEWKSQLEKSSRIFQTADSNKLTNCFLPYGFAPKSTQGGSNGEGIYIEVNESRSLYVIEEISVHEMFHKLSPISDYLLNLNHEYYSKKIDGFHNPIAGVCNEILTYAVVNINFFNDNAQENFQDEIARGDIELATIWKAADIVAQMVKDFLEGKKDKDKTKDEIVDFFNNLERKIPTFINL